MRALRVPRRHMSQINIVPYIDVMLVLLLIFMIATPLIQQGVEIDLPQAPSEPIQLADELREPLILEVNRDGQLQLMREGVFAQSVEEEGIAILVSNHMKQGYDDTLYIRADRHLAYGSVVALMARLQAAGVPALGLLTEPPTTEGAP